MKNYQFLFWGYTTVWVGLVAYLLYLGARLRKASRRIDRIEKAIERDQNDNL